MVAMAGYGSNGRCMVSVKGVWQQWKIQWKVMVAMEGYGSNGRCMVAMEGVW